MLKFATAPSRSTPWSIPLGWGEVDAALLVTALSASIGCKPARCTINDPMKGKLKVWQLGLKSVANVKWTPCWMTSRMSGNGSPMA